MISRTLVSDNSKILWIMSAFDVCKTPSSSPISTIDSISSKETELILTSARIPNTRSTRLVVSVSSFDKRAGDAAEQVERRRHPQRQPLGEVQRQILRHQLTNHQREEDDDAGDADEGNRVGVLSDDWDPGRFEPIGDECDAGDRAERRRKHAGDRNSDLNGGQETVRIFDEPERRSGAARSLLNKVLEGALADLDEGHLRPREKRVEQDQKK